MLKEQLTAEEEELSPVVVITTILLLGLFALGMLYQAVTFLL